MPALPPDSGAARGDKEPKSALHSPAHALQCRFSWHAAVLPPLHACTCKLTPLLCMLCCASRSLSHSSVLADTRLLQQALPAMKPVLDTVWVRRVGRLGCFIGCES